MIGHSEGRETLYDEYLRYCYRVAGKKYSDHPDIDALVRDSLAALILKLERGEAVEHPKGFLSAVLRHRYNAHLREKYRAELCEYRDGIMADEADDGEESEQRNEEYEAVRRELGRLIRLYREVTVRHYVHGQSVEKIAKELGLPRGTVLSRLSAARGQIKEGLEGMERYSQISYEPKSASIGIWGSCGLGGEPFSLMRSDIEANILNLAYEAPMSIRGIADTMGMPSAYLEPIIESLVQGELMGRTARGLVYTRCFVQQYGNAFGNIAAQERLAERSAKGVFEVAWRHLSPLTERTAFAEMSEKQKATMLLFTLNRVLSEVVESNRPKHEGPSKQPPERPNAGRWLATLTVYDHGQRRDIPYDGSGPVCVGYSQSGDGRYDCQLFDCQSLFGDAHWAYQSFKYQCTLPSILRFYASFLPCDVKTDNELLYELIPEFEKLGILARDKEGKVRLDIPALPFEEVTAHWNPACEALRSEMNELLGVDLRALWAKTRNRVPKHVDEAEYFTHAGALRAYVMAQLVAIVKQGLLPFPAVIGKTPLIYIAYRKKAE